MNDEIDIEYRICSVMDSDLVDGFVEVFMEPVDKTVFDSPAMPPHNNPSVMVKSSSDSSSGLQQFMNQIPQSMKQMQKQMSKQDDPRTILLLENRVDFDTRNWKYGDTLVVSFKKKKEERQ